MSANRGERASPARRPRNELRTERTREPFYRCSPRTPRPDTFLLRRTRHGKVEVGAKCGGQSLTEAPDAAVAATLPLENGTFPVTSRSGADPRCKRSPVDAARAGSPPLASSGTMLGTRSGPTSLGVTRAVSAEGLTMILAIWSNPSTMTMAAVAPIKTCSLAMPSAATRTAAACVADASWGVAASPFPACAARRAAAIRSDLPPGSGITDNLVPPILESDASTWSASPSEMSDRAASRVA